MTETFKWIARTNYSGDEYRSNSPSTAIKFAHSSADSKRRCSTFPLTKCDNLAVLQLDRPGGQEKTLFFSQFCPAKILRISLVCKRRRKILVKREFSSPECIAKLARISLYWNALRILIRSKGALVKFLSISFTCVRRMSRNSRLYFQWESPMNIKSHTLLEQVWHCISVHQRGVKKAMRRMTCRNIADFISSLLR